MSNMRFFKTFIAVAEYGSFAAAADRVALTNAAVGQQMRALEEEMRRPLFDRSQRQIKLSRDGVLLLRVRCRVERKPHGNAQRERS